MNKSLLELLKAEDLALYGYQSKHDLEMDALKMAEEAPENIKDIFQERADDYHKEAQEAEERLLSIRKEIKEYFEYIGKL